MEEIIHVSSESNQTSSLTDYTESVVKCFDSVPEVAKPLIGSAGRLFNRITLLQRLSALSKLLFPKKLIR